jgi:hypothetical protein
MAQTHRREKVKAEQADKNPARRRFQIQNPKS